MINSEFRKKMADSWFSYLQMQICKSFERLENDKVQFTKRDWHKKKISEGGGTSYLLTGGKIFDKVGILGFFICATTETPEAQYFPFFSAPKILDLNFFGNIPETVDLLTPTLSKILPPVKR